MAIRLPKFRAEVPYGKFSCRIILTPREVRRRQQIAQKLNRWVDNEVFRRRFLTRRNYDYTRSRIDIESEIRRQVLGELADKRQIYFAWKAEMNGRINPADITYEQVLGPNKKLLADPARLRTASDYFLDYLNHRRLDDNLVKKFPLLAAFLDAARVSEKDENDFSREEVMARAGASERALCAGLIGRYLNPSRTMRIGPAEVINCGLRLGIDQAFLSQEIKEVIKSYAIFSQAMGLTLVNLKELIRRMDLKENPIHEITGIPREDDEYEVKTDDQQIKNFVSMTRAVLVDRDTRLLYAAQNLCDLRVLAKERIASAQKREVEEIMNEPLTPDKPFAFYFLNQEEVTRLQYFLQVIPIAEELNVPYLTDALKEAYFMAYKPVEYLKVNYQMGEVFRFHRDAEKGPNQFSPEAAQKHVDNVIRLIREIGWMTGLLPEGAEVKGRVKSYWSAHEKFVNSPVPQDPPLYDVLGFRVLVKEAADIRKVAYLMLNTFQRASADEKRPFSGYLNPELKRYLEALRQDLEVGELHKKGYRRAIKNTLKTDFRVHYYQMILLSYSMIPMDVQITTFEMEKENEAQAPHWEYKFLRQLQLRGLGKGLERGGFDLPEDKVLVAIIDGETRTIRAEAIPRDKAFLKDHPGYQWLMPWEGRAATREERAPDQPFRTGTLLYKPGKGYLPNKIYSLVWGEPEEDPFLSADSEK